MANNKSENSNPGMVNYIPHVPSRTADNSGMKADRDVPTEAGRTGLNVTERRSIPDDATPGEKNK